MIDKVYPRSGRSLGGQMVYTLLVGSAGLFITRIWISPIYFFYVIAFSLALLLILWGNRVNRSSAKWYAIVGIFYLVGLPVELSNLQNVTVTMGFAMSLGILPVILDQGEGCTQNTIHKSAMLLIWSSIVIMIIDTIVRFKNPEYSYLAMGTNIDTADLVFYAYKFNGVMYLDSNFVGLQVAVLFGLVCYLAHYFSKQFLIEKIILATLSILTLSRASILAVLVVLIYSLRNNKKIMYFVVFTVFSSLIAWGISYLSHDQSFASKGEIWERLFQYLNTKATLVELFFGQGFNQSVNAIGIGAHNIFVLLIVERGLVGLFLMMFLWWMIGKASSWDTVYIFIPFFVNSMSLTSHSVPYFYASAGVIILLSKKV